MNRKTKLDWPGAKIEMKSTKALIPYARNSRVHGASQVRQIARSIRQWGFTFPILIDEANTILAGHARVMAAEYLKLDEVPCIVARGWSETKKRAYVIADNKLAENADWDEEILLAEIEAIRQDDAAIDMVIGFDERELEKLERNGDGGGKAVDLDYPAPQYQILIECTDEAEQLRLLESLGDKGVKCRALVA
jgi:ParB-like chromosome segregation protein Spo0J